MQNFPEDEWCYRCWLVHKPGDSKLAASKKSLVAISTPLNTLAYGDVQLHEGPMKRQFKENHARFLNLDNDRLLKVFRQVA